MRDNQGNAHSPYPYLGGGCEITKLFGFRIATIFCGFWTLNMTGEATADSAKGVWKSTLPKHFGSISVKKTILQKFSALNLITNEAIQHASLDNNFCQAHSVKSFTIPTTLSPFRMIMNKSVIHTSIWLCNALATISIIKV